MAEDQRDHWYTEALNLLGFGHGQAIEKTVLEKLQEAAEVMEEFHTEIKEYIVNIKKEGQ